MAQNILVFGGSGKVARLLTSKLVASGKTVHSVIRNPTQFDSIKELGAKPLVHSIEDASVSELVQTIREAGPPDAVVFAAGAGGGSPERTERVDHQGAVKTMDACAEVGVKRFVIVSAIDVRDRSKGEPDWYN